MNSIMTKSPRLDSDPVNKFYGWILIGVFFCIYFLNSTFPYYGASVINSYMAKALALDRTILGLGFSIFTVSLALSSPIVSLSVNRIGTRWTLLAGCILIMIGALLMSVVVTASWHYLIVFGIIVGTGVSMGGVIPIQSGVTFWFKKRKALAMSIVLSAAGIGGIVAAPLLNKVISTSGNNWKLGWVVVAATATLSAAISVIAVRNKPEEMGQFPDGLPSDNNYTNPSAADLSIQGQIYQSTRSWRVADALKTKSLWLIILASIAFLMPYITCVAHGVAHLQSSGYPQSLSALSVGLLVFFSIIGRIIGGVFGDRIEPRIIWSVALCFVVTGMSILGRSATLGPVSIYLYAFFMGTGMGAAYVCMATIIGNYFGAQAFASIMGTIFPIIFLAAAMGPFLAGFFYDRQGSYDNAFNGLTALAFIGAIMVLIAKPPLTAEPNL
jgi:MFS family permease